MFGAMQLPLNNPPSVVVDFSGAGGLSGAVGGGSGGSGAGGTTSAPTTSTSQGPKDEADGKGTTAALQGAQHRRFLGDFTVPAGAAAAEAAPYGEADAARP